MFVAKRDVVAVMHMSELIGDIVVGSDIASGNVSFMQIMNAYKMLGLRKVPFAYFCGPYILFFGLISKSWNKGQYLRLLMFLILYGMTYVMFTKQVYYTLCALCSIVTLTE